MLQPRPDEHSAAPDAAGADAPFIAEAPGGPGRCRRVILLSLLLRLHTLSGIVLSTAFASIAVATWLFLRFPDAAFHIFSNDAPWTCYGYFLDLMHAVPYFAAFYLLAYPPAALMMYRMKSGNGSDPLRFAGTGPTRCPSTTGVGSKAPARLRCSRGTLFDRLAAGLALSLTIPSVLLFIESIYRLGPRAGLVNAALAFVTFCVPLLVWIDIKFKAGQLEEISGRPGAASTTPAPRPLP